MSRRRSRPAHSSNHTDPSNRKTPADRSGIHLLKDPSVARRLARSSGVGPGDLVVEFGAGTGVLTTVLAASGARVVAVERHPRFVERLERRFGDDTGVRIVSADARSVPLPRRSFTVVANIPYAISTPLLRRLLGPDRTPVTGADLVVEWGFAKRMTADVPRDAETAWWRTRFDLHIADRIPAGRFDPAPSVDSAHLVVRRRNGMSPRAARAAGELLRARSRAPHRPAKEVLGAHVPKKRAHRLLTSTGIDPPAPAGSVPIALWLRLAEKIENE
ncbi:23S rRNA (adenine-N6)-dimethyltransferase [Haloactinopolyspora alba]|uniref:23S rRNA (Adenine-N6)-dimethyltransferase n=1 Tax=Haloactinopolyspora alba TaxID=648780 RepID=A0A2P8DXT8_9ACTN|nr:rRNA adenine N(6)-methyltransferase family protein [Haloactinopolyspora alba]PSL02048.1 23S rRNA (adenine-N6)-dimethyltransferase [Haloactinopolyspora alba]